MSWLRIDDSFTSHPKILALRTPGRRWTWLEVLTYTCRYHSPVVPTNIADAIPKATQPFILDCISLILIDVQEGGDLHVHDWELYADLSVGEKVDYYLGTKNPDASANEVYRAIGGKRELVLHEVARFRNGSQTVPNPVPDDDIQRFPGTAEPGSQSGSRARAPDPYPTQESTPEGSSVTANSPSTSYGPSYEATAKETERERQQLLRQAQARGERDDDGQPFKIDEMQKLGGKT